jgi:quercetin dioxygenase-like cupin family protein
MAVYTNSIAHRVFRSDGKSMKLNCIVGIFAGALISAMPAGAAPAAKDTIVLQRVPVPGTDRELAMGIADFPPNARKPRHRAIGPELIYVLAGELIVQADDQPTAVVHVGQSDTIPAGVVHVTTAGPSGARVFATWVGVSGSAFNVSVPR